MVTPSETERAQAAGDSVRMDVQDLRRLVVERDREAEAGARLELLRGRQVHRDLEWAVVEEVQGVLEAQFRSRAWRPP